MDKFLQQEIVAFSGPLNGAIIQKVEDVPGGCIHNAWKLTLEDSRIFFAKTASSEAFSMLSFEANGLKALHKYTDQQFLLIPKPISIKQYKNTALLLMPWLDLGKGNQNLLGQGLALLHQNSANENHQSFGWEDDGFIGSGKQPGGWEDSWGECFVKLRLLPQLKVATKWGINLFELEELLISITHYLNKHNPKKSLVHGDLWSGNYGINKEGKGILFDPAVWWADREVDISMTKLFGGFSKEFYIGYEKVWPLPICWHQRIEIYNLYHLLNHANIFGGSYISQSLNSISNLKSNLTC